MNFFKIKTIWKNHLKAIKIFLAFIFSYLQISFFNIIYKNEVMEAASIQDKKANGLKCEYG